MILDRTAFRRTALRHTALYRAVVPRARFERLLLWLLSRCGVDPAAGALAADPSPIDRRIYRSRRQRHRR